MVGRDARGRVTPLIIVGAGGFGREAAEAVHAVNAAGPRWELAGFLDDDVRLLGTTIGGLPVLGPFSAAAEHPGARLVVTPARPGGLMTRRDIVLRLGLPATRYAAVIHPDASLARSTDVGGGSVLLAGVVATAGVVVGEHVAVMPGVVLTHDVVVGDFATIASGAQVSGGVRIDEGAYIGAGALIREGCRIGAWSLVGMGAVVLHDVPPGEVWAGVPARRLRRLDGAAASLRGAA